MGRKEKGMVDTIVRAERARNLMHPRVTKVIRRRNRTRANMRNIRIQRSLKEKGMVDTIVRAKRVRKEKGMVDTVVRAKRVRKEKDTKARAIVANARSIPFTVKKMINSKREKAKVPVN